MRRPWWKRRGWRWIMPRLPNWPLRPASSPYAPISQRAEAEAAQLKAEARALAELLQSGGNEGQQALIDAVTVAAGAEGALAAALGEAMQAPLDPHAALYWRELDPLDPAPVLPDGVPPLAALVQAPPALARALSQVGVVEDEAAGHALAGALSPGQILVTKAGAAWRWDGFTITAGAPTAAALRLKQRNRLAELGKAMARAAAAADEAEAALTEPPKPRGMPPLRPNANAGPISVRLWLMPRGCVMSMANWLRPLQPIRLNKRAWTRQRQRWRRNSRNLRRSVNRPAPRWPGCSK